MVHMQAWLQDIAHATSQAEVVANARDYVCLWAPRELPDDCRELRIDGEADIPRWSERLASGTAAMAGRPGAERLRELVAYLARASERLGELRGGP
jgi:hypothetical protein